MNRFKSLKNIIWVVSEEYSEVITTSRARAIAARIRALDRTHAIAVHQLSGSSFKFAGDANARVFEMQLSAAVNTVDLVRDSVQQAVDAAAGRYAVVLAEAAWHRALVAAGDRAVVRQSNWAAVMAGAAGVLVFGLWEPTVPDTAMLGDFRRLKTFFDGVWVHLSAGGT